MIALPYAGAIENHWEEPPTMKILVVGRGAREHAIVWKVRRSKRVDTVFCATGNAGVAEMATLVDIRAEEIDALAAFVKKEKIDFTVVGPEVALTEGIVDRFEAEGLKVFGPSKKAAHLETSKAFAKQLMCKYKIPTAKFGVFSDQEEAFRHLEAGAPPYVIKADGIDSGKGLIIAKDEITARLAVNVILKDKIFGDAGKSVVIEEMVTGRPLSVVAFTDGKRILGATTCGVFSRVYDGDRGPFTGGMGAFSPDPRCDGALLADVRERILLPTIAAMAKEGRVLKGVLYMNLILTADGPKVVDFQTRFNDPAAQVVLPRLKGDFVDLLEHVVDGKASPSEFEFDSAACVSVSLVSGGYPMKYSTGRAITGLDKVSASEDVLLFHARTGRAGDRWQTTGGRVLSVVGRGATVEEARKTAYREAEKIFFQDIHFRRDIASNLSADPANPGGPLPEGGR